MYSECTSVYETKIKEKKRSNKLEKKVSRFRDLDGHIKKEMEECKKWINVLDSSNITRFCYQTLIYEDFEYKKMSREKFDIEIYHKLKHSINRNNYHLSKIYKENGFAVYQKEDVYIFLLVLFEAIKRKMIVSFLDIPDVFYILRQIKGVGLDYYFVKS